MFTHIDCPRAFSKLPRHAEFNKNKYGKKASTTAEGAHGLEMNEAHKI